MKRVLIGAAIVVLISSCGPLERGTEPLAVGTVTGTVTLRSCGGAYRPEGSACQMTPMQNATISFSGSSGQQVAKTTTDSSGRYLIKLRAGSYNVEVNGHQATYKLSQVSGSRTVTVISGQTQTADFMLTIELL
jgi:hypothetical protein